MTDIAPVLDYNLVKYLHEHDLEITVRTFSGTGKFGGQENKIVFGVRTKPGSQPEESDTTENNEEEKRW